MRSPHDPSSERVQDLLESARHELRDVPHFGAAREQELVERILAATTRAPARPSWRRGSWISVAAAALLVGATAVLLFSRRTQDRPAQMVASLPAAPPLAAPTGAAPIRAAPIRAAPIQAAPLAVRPELDQRDVLALARAELVASAAAARRTSAGTEAGAEAPLELRLLEARAKGLRERRWEPWLREIQLTDLGTLSLALWCEVELDRYLLDGARPPGWKHAVEIVQRDLARPETPKEGSKLLAHALDRARDYGLTEDVVVARLEPTEPPWSGQWFDDLDAARREAGLAETGMWRAWADWRGR